MFPTLSANDSDLDQDRSNSIGNTQIFNNFSPSGSNLRIIEESIPLEPQLQCSNRKDISHCHFNIKGGDTFMAITQDEDEPMNVTKAISGPDKENWTKAMEEKMEFVRSN